MKFALTIDGPEHWQVRLFRDDRQWLNVLVEWHLEGNVSEWPLSLSIVGEMPGRHREDGTGIPFALAGPVTALFRGDRDSCGSRTAYDRYRHRDGEPIFVVEAEIPDLPALDGE